ncbi:Radical SAM superfamily protein [Rosistilla ulvae]|uniref:Radical SAM superfamily protein n=1 Tax=Rosistilla ulvae TaxID=1930277 RepID=A0A517LVK1_9BACT|nr:PA0069 family radical SAM protein [Rosistilla ulvae]QDS86639.1 Radical SAM superfamily protein [Rosistilla ulvae]
MRHGSELDPPNRFESIRRELDLGQMEWDQEHLAAHERREIEYLPDDSKSIVSENKSPDIPFRYSVNPYRGCAHGCSYCYARNTHEFLGFNAGLDFETKIMVKHKAPQLLETFLNRKSYQPETISFSGVTDCYQPAERQFRLTRQCLEVALRYQQPVGIVSKNALVVRDLDLLQLLAAQNLVHVYLSITTLQPELARAMEPRTSIPTARLRAVRMLAEAGVPVGVMVAPVIPGLNDSEIPAILDQARQAGAATANFILLRLPLTVEPVFREWLQRTQPEKQELIEARVRQTRDGSMYDSQWNQRMRGSGPIAEQIKQMFQLFAKKHGLDKPLPPVDSTRFKNPNAGPQQMDLF